ncbi:hypothetical protein GQE99_17605 [Maritimibacter sp. DP07]|uniref:Sulfotransferase family protein n=1 Tax=Maritimibacter harenae TaxID=2606218 RepID=A0A845MBP9_9RHOB|nr:hypothetical protein [Maritimibacter harenae]
MTDRTARLGPLLARAEEALNAGRFADMHAALEDVFAVDPGSLAGLWTYTHGTRFAKDDPVLARIEAFLAQAGLADPLRAQLLFMRAKARDDLGEHEAGFEDVVAANRLKGVRFDDAGMAALTRALIAAVEAAPDIRLPPSGPRMVFVLGMPRSGTSLASQMLAAHPEITNLGERVALGPALARPGTGRNPHLAFLEGLDRSRLQAARAAYLEGVPDHGIFIDKMPENYVFAWAIPMLFPDAQIIHMRRDRRATSRSVRLTSCLQAPRAFVTTANAAATASSIDRWLVSSVTASGAGFRGAAARLSSRSSRARTSARTSA